MKLSYAGARSIAAGWLVSVMGVMVACAQQPASPQAGAPDSPKGTVLFSRDSADGAVATTQNKREPGAPIAITDLQRDAIAFAEYKLDVHLVPAESAIWTHAELTLRNGAKEPLKAIALQISSALKWESVRLRQGDSLLPLDFSQQPVETDADHTGKANEARIVLREPVAAGATVHIDTIYSGRIERSADRLERIGAPFVQAQRADWDTVSADFTGLRGFGNVLWFPVATHAVFLGEGATLFEAAGRTRVRDAAASVRLRLTVEYTGTAPTAAIFCGKYELLTATSEGADLPASNAPGVATAEFSLPSLGFRTLSLFLVQAPLVIDANGRMLAATWQENVVPAYQRAASRVDPLVTEWLGPAAQPLVVLDLPENASQPFSDASLLAVAMRDRSPESLAPELVHALSLSRLVSHQAWMSEGVALFLDLLWTERTEGRGAAIAQMQQRSVALALLDSGTPAQSLIDAHDELFFRVKAADVLWMLRDIVGDEPLQRALQQYRKASAGTNRAVDFEAVLERTTGTSLSWFFQDWVLNDKGLPDLSIVSVAPRAVGNGKGTLLAVEVANDGGAVAEVPVTVRSGSLVKTDRLRIAGNSRATVRILFEGAPEEITVNDGSVPEQRASIHSRKISGGL